MSRYQALFVGFPIVSALLGISTAASAHHESWILKNAGTQCTFETPNIDGLDNYGSTALFNGSFEARWMSCPVALSARWGSSSPSYPVARWARAYTANVYLVNNDPGTAFSCTARAFMSSSALRYSRTVTTTLGGNQKLTPAFTNSSGVSDWGGTLEAAEGQTLRALDFQCSVPGNWSGVYGHKVRMCIRNAGCGDSRDPDDAFTTLSAGSETIQTSGIECTSYMNPEIERGHFGIRNTATGYGSVYCPIVPSADDTNEVRDRSVTSTVYFKGAPSQGPFPTCQLTWRNRTGGVPVGEEFWSEAFLHNNPEDDFVRSVAIGVGQDVSMAVLCDLPPGVVLQGITTKMSVAPISGGF